MLHTKSLTCSRRRIGKLCLAAGAVLVLGRQGRADEIYWQGSVGDWFDANNWIDYSQTNQDGDYINQVPGASDYVYVNNAGDAIINSGSAFAYLQAVCGGSSGTIGVTGSISQNGGSFTLVGNSNSIAALYLGGNSADIGYYSLSGTGEINPLSTYNN